MQCLRDYGAQDTLQLVLQHLGKIVRAARSCLWPLCLGHFHPHDDTTVWRASGKRVQQTSRTDQDAQTGFSATGAINMSASGTMQGIPEYVSDTGLEH